MGASNVHPWKHIVSHGDRNAVYDMRERTILVTSSVRRVFERGRLLQAS